MTDSLEQLIVSIAQTLRDDPSSRESFHQLKLKFEKESKTANAAFDKFKLASVAQKQQMIDEQLSRNK